MTKRLADLDEDDAPILTAELRVLARPATEVLPPEVIAAFGKKRGRPKAQQVKRPVNIRLSLRVIDHFKAGGESGWQTRLNEALEAMVDRAKP